MRSFGLKANKIPSRPAWYLRVFEDGTTYYTFERRSKRKIILAGPSDRNPSPGELATALELHPEAELESGAKLLIEHDAESAEESIELPGGFYNYERSTHIVPERLEPMVLRQDTYHPMPGVFDRLASDIDNFQNGELVYRELGLQYRRGILLYGSPGNGKTSLIREVLRAHILQDAVVIFLDHIPSRHFIRVIQETLSTRLKVIIFEEMAAVLKGSNLDHALAFLDGELSLDRCLILATTNYPERLPGNIVDRPSRFDRLYRVPEPNDNGRKILLQHYLGRDISPSEISATKGLSTAALREASLLVRLKNMDLTNAAKQLKNHRELVRREFGAVGEIGFGATIGGHDEDY